MDNQYGYAYKATGLPSAVDEEFRDSADALGLSIKAAFLHLLRCPLQDEDALDARMRAEIVLGLKRADEFDAEEGTLLSLHIPDREAYEALIRTARGLSLHVGAAGRYILVARAGGIHAALLAALEKEERSASEAVAVA